ncbi:HupE/UreJ family protein [Frigidibacter sp. RF13]|uniref:HupE/UreJ family protein n=1 Tax=Frigidibacter sp. RF13 TaxID=2997340 RepID=UPI002270FC00|nr:HupE/UreJ family protein [Frigidibacter sp. RF13]MCY1126677.1 HupE/UreJ family protein [Frigidibacter sp. RF13]
MTAIPARHLSSALHVHALIRIALALAALFVAPPARAHVFEATGAVVYFDEAGQRYSVALYVNIEAILAGVDPEVKDSNDSPKAAEYNRLRAMPPEDLKKAYDRISADFLAGMTFLIDGRPDHPELLSAEFAEVGDLSKVRKTIFTFQGQLPPSARTFAFGWKPEFGKIFLRTMAPRARSPYVETIAVGEMSETIVIADVKTRSAWNMVKDFISIGFTHILPKGLDHILFVVGIFLLSIKVRPILTQVTSFTVAHTLTLGLGSAGYVNLPTSIVEPLIAASIVYVAVENILRPTLSPWRPMVVFGFGLLHGLGFAGILREFGIPKDDFLLGLLSFNVGVELGQLTVITICFLLVGIWFGNKSWYRQRVVIPGSLVVAAVGAYWFVQRVAM